MDYKDYFKGKKITVMGLGLLGRGVGDAAFLAECGAELIVTDLKPEADLTSSLEKLKDFPDIRYTLGEHTMEDFEGRDLILVAPSVPLDSLFLSHARKAGARLTQSAALFTELAKIPVIGVTGTRGKSTVSHMIHHVLEETTGERVILGGNVRGVSNLQLLKEVHEDSLAVLELDSWQLQGFGWAELSPQIAIFTNFMEDHMNYYHGDMDLYFADKANIFRYQEESGVFVTTPEVFERAKQFARGEGVTLGQEVVLVDASVLPVDVELLVPGAHNRLNAALATAALRATGLTDEEIFKNLATFIAVPGRLEFLREVGGVKIYNDNNSTTPQATTAALKALDPEGKQNILLICGGTDKGLDVETGIKDAVHAHAKQVFFLAGTGTDRIAKRPDDVVYDSLKGAVKAAFEAAVPGDIILFSPAFASFGMFKNEYDRGDQFVQLIETL